MNEELKIFEEHIQKNRLYEYNPEGYKKAYLKDLLDDIEKSKNDKDKVFQVAVHNNFIIKEVEYLIVKEIKEIIKNRITDKIEAEQLCSIIEGAIISYSEDIEITKMEENAKFIEDENSEGNTYEEFLEQNYIKK